MTVVLMQERKPEHKTVRSRLKLVISLFFLGMTSSNSVYFLTYYSCITKTASSKLGSPLSQVYIFVMTIKFSRNECSIEQRM